MKLPKRKDKRTMLEKDIARIEEKMSKLDPTSKDYAELQEALAKAYEIETRLIEVKAGVRKTIDPNTLLVVGGGILEILLIMHHERVHVIATKAFSRVIRGRI